MSKLFGKQKRRMMFEDSDNEDDFIGTTSAMKEVTMGKQKKRLVIEDSDGEDDCIVMKKSAKQAAANFTQEDVTTDGFSQLEKMNQEKYIEEEEFKVIIIKKLCFRFLPQRKEKTKFLKIIS